MRITARLFSTVLVLAFLATTLTGCGSIGSSGGSNVSSEKASVPAFSADNDSASSESAPAQTSAASTASPDGVSSSAASASSAPAPADTVRIEESLVFEDGGIRITAKGYEEYGFLGPQVKLLIENGSSRAITVQVRDCSVNGYMIDTSMSADVAAGKKANDELTLMSSDLEAAGIDTVAEIEFSFHIFDSETWDTILDSEIVHIETTAAEGFTPSYDDSGTRVLDRDGITIVVKGLSEEDSWLGPSVVVYIHNTTEQDITVQARNVSVNDFMVDVIFSCDVLSGKRAVDTITFRSSDLEENGIDAIEELELTFHIFDKNTWDTVLDTDTVFLDFH